MLRRLMTAAILVAACADTTEPFMPNVAGFWSGDAWHGRVFITTDPDDPQWPADPVMIHSSAIRADSLELSVSYGGGCVDHSFSLLANAAWMESNPVQAGVQLAHDARGDGCKALVSRLLRFDLSPLKAAYANSYQTATGVIRLNVLGSTSVTYSW